LAKVKVTPEMRQMLLERLKEEHARDIDPSLLTEEEFADLFIRAFERVMNDHSIRTEGEFCRALEEAVEREAWIIRHFRNRRN
jgi:hypothetical protein